MWVFPFFLLRGETSQTHKIWPFSANLKCGFSLNKQIYFTFVCTLQNTHTRAKILYPSVNLGPIYMKNNLRRAECEAISTLWELCCAKKAYQDLQDANQSKPEDQLHVESIVNPWGKTILQTINGASWSIIAAMLCCTYHRHWLSGQAAFLQQARKFTTSNDNCRP